MHDIENITIRDANNLWTMYSTGVCGPYKDYTIGYHALAQRHHSLQAFGSANFKKYKRLDLAKFDEVFPGAHSWWSMGRVDKEPEDIALNAARMMVATSDGAPDWLVELVKPKEDEDAVTDKG